MNDSPNPLHPKNYLDQIGNVKNLLIVGGQAVYLWADALLKPAEEEEFGPYTSKDMDVIGTADTVLEIAQATGWKYVFAPMKTATPIIGRLEGTASNGETLIIEVLKNLHGLNPADIKTPVTIEYNGKPYRTLSPITLLKAKLANCSDLDQTKREDVRQTRILIACVSEYIKLAVQEAELGKTSERAVINTLESLYEICGDQKFEKALKKYKFPLENAFPAELRYSELTKARKFCELRLPALIAKLQDRRGEPKPTSHGQNRDPKRQD